MAGSSNHLTVELANAELVAVGKQAVELVAIWCKIITQVEYRPEMFLNLADTLADRDRSADARFDVLRTAQVIRMRVCFEYPLETEFFLVHILDDDVGRRRFHVARHH
jgi:hypothetical protein